jgi:hypothetical protein
MNVFKPEINELLRLVEAKYHKSLFTTTDFEEFSYHLKKTIGNEISASTIKRMWGYVNDVHEPRMHTLDLLSIYLGYESFNDFSNFLKTSTAYNSSFFTAQQLLSKDLNIGDEIEIGWAPNRYVKLLYKGESNFEVLLSEQSKFEVGDSFVASTFLKGQPLLIPYILRDGKQTPPFIAGRNGGLTLLTCLKHE